MTQRYRYHITFKHLFSSCSVLRNGYTAYEYVKGYVFFINMENNTFTYEHKHVNVKNSHEDLSPGKQTKSQHYIKMSVKSAFVGSTNFRFFGFKQCICLDLEYQNSIKIVKC